ncbi:MAG: hypothetical protein SFW09_08805 [Hyphomicrobiaceae bacterium]|nr:hypothetical protein [Hyphomicrobiaceae bacterium]
MRPGSGAGLDPSTGDGAAHAAVAAGDAAGDTSMARTAERSLGNTTIGAAATVVVDHALAAMAAVALLAVVDAESPGATARASMLRSTQLPLSQLRVQAFELCPCSSVSRM